MEGHVGGVLDQDRNADASLAYHARPVVAEDPAPVRLVDLKCAAGLHCFRTQLTTRIP